MFWSIIPKKKYSYNVASVLDSALLLGKYTADFSQQLKKVKNFTKQKVVVINGCLSWLLIVDSIQSIGRFYCQDFSPKDGEDQIT